jgi:alkanesulfonate monooxygenase SsuD/methylene tetrahydromethanopterin reductase-like flavin-dependent oxidoreductase (luciferase family)
VADGVARPAPKPIRFLADPGDVADGKALREVARRAEAIGRDPAVIERTMAAPVLVAADEATAAAMLSHVPPERRAFVAGGTVEQAAAALRPYLDAGFTGFTFNNNIYRTPEQIAPLGDLLRLIGG